MTNNHYVDNVAFYNAFKQRKELVNSSLISAGLITSDELSSLSHEDRKILIKKAKRVGNIIPKIDDFLGNCFLDMANNIIYKYNFNRYPYKDEMISDGIVDCLKYVDTFDSSRENPFAYFTSAISNAFIRRIKREKREGYVKSKLLSNSDVDIFELQEQDDSEDFLNTFKEYMIVYNNYDGSMFEKPKKEKVITYKGATLEWLIENEI